jgi:hypothetical protein
MYGFLHGLGDSVNDLHTGAAMRGTELASFDESSVVENHGRFDVLAGENTSRSYGRKDATILRRRMGGGQTRLISLVAWPSGVWS